MSHFEAALNNRPRDKSVLEPIIIAWKSLSVTEKRLVENLYKEHFASVAEMNAFIMEILPFSSLPAGQFREKVILTYQRHTRKGDMAIFSGSVEVVGFSLTVFTIDVVIHANHLDDFLQDETMLQEFLSKKSIGTADVDYDTLSIKGTGSIIWITWSESSDDPFDFMTHGCCAEVYNALALSDHYKKGPIFLFKTTRQKITRKADLLRPTVFDAGGYAPFLPANAAFNGYGFTDPYNNDIFCLHGLPLSANPRPEAIVDGTNICWNDIDVYHELK